MTRRLRVAAVGAGYFARFHLDAWRRLPEAALVALCDLDDAKAKSAAAEFAIPATFDRVGAMLDAVAPDLLDIAAPPAAHRVCLEAAVARGVTAICQKPFCASLAEAEAIVAAAQAAGVTIVVHENFRFQPWHRAAKRLIERGALGAVLQITFRLRPGDGQGRDAYLDRQPYFRAMQRFLVHETAIHFIDTFRFLLGEVSGVFARLARLNPVIAGEDAGIILFEFRGGARGLFDGNRVVDHAARNRRLTMGEMLVEGADAALRLDGDGRLFLRPRGRDEEQKVAYAWEDRGFGGDCVHALQSHVLAHRLAGATLENDAASYLANLRLEAAIYESAAQGRWIAVTAGGAPVTPTSGPAPPVADRGSAA